MNTIQKTAITATIALLAGAVIYEARQGAQWRGQNRALQQQQAALAEQIQQLRRDRDEAASRLGTLFAENERMKSGRDEAELLRLRGEVGQLRQEMPGLPAARVALLKRKLAEMPDKAIPELKLLADQDWKSAAWNADLDTDDGVRVALSKLRNEAVDAFLNLTRTALKEYMAANNDMLPSDLLPLKPYYDAPVTDDMLQRYAFMQTGQLSANLSEPVVRTTVYADPDYDSNSQMAMNGASGSLFTNIQSAIAQAVWAFTIDNKGQPPGDPSQIASYLNRPIDDATIQKYLGGISANIAANLPPAAATALAPAFKAYAAANHGQFPQDPSALPPYLTTPEQQAALHNLYQNTAAPKGE